MCRFSCSVVCILRVYTSFHCVLLRSTLPYFVSLRLTSSLVPCLFCFVVCFLLARDINVPCLFCFLLRASTVPCGAPRSPSFLLDVSLSSRFPSLPLDLSRTSFFPIFTLVSHSLRSHQTHVKMRTDREVIPTPLLYTSLHGVACERTQDPRDCGVSRSRGRESTEGGERERERAMDGARMRTVQLERGTLYESLGESKGSRLRAWRVIYRGRAES